MLDCEYLVGLAVVMAAIVAIAAWIVGRIIARMREPNAWGVIAAIVVSLAVLQLGARLAVISEWLYGQVGLDPTAVCGGQLRTAAFAATLFIIAAYVGSFFLSFTRARKAG